MRRSMPDKLLIQLIQTALLLIHACPAIGNRTQKEKFIERSPWQQICEHGCLMTPMVDNIATVLDTVVKAAPKCIPCAQGYADYFQLETLETYTKQNGSCYKALPGQQHWTEAAKSCKKIGGNLVSIETEEESEHMRRVLYNEKGISETHSLWTGGRNTGKGRWVWTGTGQDIVFSNWAIGKPEDIPDSMNKDFLCLGRSDLKWHRAWDSTIATGICEKQSVCQPNLIGSTLPD